MKYIKMISALITISLFIPVSANAQFSNEDIQRATLPLPEELRTDATVFFYDESGERVLLRTGTNHVECQPKHVDGYTRCSSTSSSERTDFTARMTAQGMSGEELQAALDEAEMNGLLPPQEIGSIRYYRYEENDRINLLWVVALPYALSEDIGMPTASQRENAIAGIGLPWMMLEGTSDAHLMIPINATEFSNPISH